MLTAIMLMEVILEKKQSLHTLCENMKMYPQYLQNVRVIDKKAIIENEAVQRKKHEIEKMLGENGRIILRESGTEPVIRVMAEATTDELCRQLVEKMVSVIEDNI
jgi:phosphoglucosamine mutase